MEAPRCRRIVLKAVATTCESSEIIHAASDVSTRTQVLIAFSLPFCIMFFFTPNKGFALLWIQEQLRTGYHENRSWEESTRVRLVTVGGASRESSGSAA